MGKSVEAPLIIQRGTINQLSDELESIKRNIRTKMDDSESFSDIIEHDLIEKNKQAD